MAITIPSMSINPGDPVTSDLLSLIITNLQTVAKGETVSNVAVDAAGLANSTDSATKTTVAYNTVVPVVSAVTVKSSTAGGTVKEIKFGKTFVGTPHVMIQINSIGQTSPSWANSQVFPQVESVSSTNAFVRFRTNTANGKVQFTAFIVGQLA
jgi:hypothetical protein